MRSVLSSASRHLCTRVSAPLPWCNSRCFANTLRIDSRTRRSEFERKLKEASNSHSEGLDLVLVGQAGILTGLCALGELRRRGRAPVFTLQHEEYVGRHEPARSAWRANTYRLTLPALNEWKAHAELDAASAPSDLEKGGKYTSTLVVKSPTPLQTLAKALAQRVAYANEGQLIAMETDLFGHDRLRKLRVQKMVHAFARAYSWQVTPADHRLPTRPFRCIASLEGPVVTVEYEWENQEAWAGTVLRLDAVPMGPRKHGLR